MLSYAELSQQEPPAPPTRPDPLSTHLAHVTAGTAPAPVAGAVSPTHPDPSSTHLAHVTAGAAPAPVGALRQPGAGEELLAAEGQRARVTAHLDQIG